MRLRSYVLLLTALTASAPAFAQQSALTVSRNLEQLTERAADIVRGSVVSARVEEHPELQGLDTMVVTIRVKETLKGTASGTFTFRQYLWDLRSRTTSGGYRKGQDLLLLMIAPSRYGLSSPAGLEQGRFLIHRDGAGREVAINGHANSGLFEGLGLQFAREGKSLAPELTRLIETHRAGPVPIDELSRLIREMSQGSR